MDVFKLMLMYRNPELPSAFRRISVSLLIAFAVAVTGIAVELLVDGSRHMTVSLVDNVLVGLMTALILFVYEQRQHNNMVSRINVIAAMNHHVRNALQVISYAPHADQAEQIRIIDESVRRIEWALREVLSAESATKDLFASPKAADDGIKRERS